jgi:glutamate transport system permease protein
VLIASVVSAAALTGLLIIAVQRLSERGQLDSERWTRFFKPTVLGFLWDGVYNTLKLALAAMALALAAALLLALLRISRRAPLRWAAASWIEVFRGVPLVLLILFMFVGTELSAYRAALAALALYNSAVLAEIIRAGILSLDRGQSQAALALGLSETQAMRYVVLPQALRRMVPALVSQLITLLKDTSLAAIITYPGLLRHFQIAAKPSEIGQPGADLQGYVLCALVFVAINLCLSQTARRLEVRQRRRYQAGGIGVTGADDLTVVMGAD